MKRRTGEASESGDPRRFADLEKRLAIASDILDRLTVDFPERDRAIIASRLHDIAIYSSQENNLLLRGQMVEIVNSFQQHYERYGLPRDHRRFRAHSPLYACLPDGKPGEGNPAR